jgi:hypothetical protein
VTIAATIAVVAVAVVVVASRGSEAPRSGAIALPDTPTAPIATVPPAPSPSFSSASSGDACEAEVGKFLDALETLDSRLNVGVQFADYGRYVGDVSVQYNKLDIKAMDQDCIRKVGVPAENAFNDYTSAQNTWNKCISHLLSCSLVDIKPQLHKKWQAAAREIAKAKTGLDRLG